MRILHLVSYSLYSGPLPPTVGLAQAQRAAGHEVWLAYDTKRGAFNDFEEPAAPRLAGLGLDPPARLVLSAKSSVRELRHDVATLRRLATAADVVHAHLSHDHLLTRLALGRRPGVARLRTFHAERSFYRRWGQAWVNGAAEGWIVRADAHRRQLLGAFDLPAARVWTIPSGFDARSFVPADAASRGEARRRLDLPAEAFVIAHVALIADRGQRELVSALAAFAPASRPYVLFVGRGEGELALRAHVAASGMAAWVRFAGYLRGPELHAAYAAADAAFVAQPGNDASARAALEALAGEVPLIAVAAGSLRELVTIERGFPIASRAPAAIAEAVRSLRANIALARARAAAARRYVVMERTFAEEATTTLALYELARAAVVVRASSGALGLGRVVLRLQDRSTTEGPMSSHRPQDSTEQLIAEAEAMRGPRAGKKTPRTRQLVRDAERLLGREPAKSATSSLRRVLVLALFTAALATLFFLFA